MTLTTHPTPAPCSTGSWSQQWNCGWNEPVTTASHAGYIIGHTVIPLLVIAAVVIAVVVSVARRRRNANAPWTRTWGQR